MDIQTIEWAGSITGLAGATLLAMNTKISRYGWLFFLASNGLLITFSLLGGHKGLLLMQCGFTLTSLLGIFRTWSNSGNDLSTKLTARDHRRYFTK